MSNPNTPEPILSSVAAETQVPDEHGTEITITEPVKSKKKIVLSLIRHAQVVMCRARLQAMGRAKPSPM